MRNKNSLTFGSNFGYQSHFKSIARLKKTKFNFIYSPSAHKKNEINKQQLLSKTQIKKKIFHTVLIATPPAIQNKICISRIKKKTKYFFLEKPLTEDYNKTLKLFELFKKKK
jgi:hypothetical protein